MKYYQYKTDFLPMSDIVKTKFFKQSVQLNTMDDMLNQYGNQGWELVSVVTVGDNTSVLGLIYSFKRETSQPIVSKNENQNSGNSI